MKLQTLLMLSATGMIATGAVVWSTVEPAHGSGGGNQVATPEAPPVKAPPPIDLAHFSAGKTLMMEGRLGHAVLPANVDNETYLFVDVSAAKTVARTPAPLDLSIVIDKSGSMAGKRMTNALAAARTAVERLRDGDVVSVVSFNTETQIVVSPTVVDAASRKRITTQINSIFTGGDTCISCGVETAMGLLGQRDGMVKRILVLSDGIPDGPGNSAGVRDIAGFTRIAENCRRMGASVTTIGVDVGYDEKIMAALARGSNGHHYFVADPTGLAPIFEQEMASLSKTVANRAELRVDLAPGVFADHIYDRATTSDGTQIVVPLGTFAAEDHKTLLVRLRVPRGGVGDRPIAAVRLRYDDLAESKDGSCEGKLAAHLTSDTSILTPLDGLVSARLSSTETADALERANDLFRQGRAAEARGLLSRQEAKLKLARKAARPSKWDSDRKLDDAFGVNEGRLGGAGAAFDPASPLKPGADSGGQGQVRQNQVDANLSRQ